MSAELSELRVLLLARGYIYSLFHKLLGGVPNAELIEVLYSQPTIDAFDEFAAESDSMMRLVSLLRSNAEAFNPDDLDAIQDEYTRMFLGPGRLVALPWAGPYLSKERLFFQESTLVVRQAYRDAGMKPRALARIPDDHVSLMCCFMAELNNRAVAASESFDMLALAKHLRSSEAFLSQHMATWLTAFAEMARKGATALLYPQMTEGLAEYVRADGVFLSEASYWAEHAGDIAKPLTAEDIARTAAFEAALAKLQRIRLRGIEDNELVPL